MLQRPLPMKGTRGSDRCYELRQSIFVSLDEARRWRRFCIYREIRERTRHSSFTARLISKKVCHTIAIYATYLAPGPAPNDKKGNGPSTTNVRILTFFDHTSFFCSRTTDGPSKEFAHVGDKRCQMCRRLSLGQSMVKIALYLYLTAH